MGRRDGLLAGGAAPRSLAAPALMEIPARVVDEPRWVLIGAETAAAFEQQQIDSAT
jgi:hypothetical protein